MIRLRLVQIEPLVVVVLRGTGCNQCVAFSLMIRPPDDYHVSVVVVALVQ
jgi:hypothetical protein